MPKPSIGATARPLGVGGKRKDASLGSMRQTLETRQSNRCVFGLAAWGARGEWQQRNVSGALHRYGDRALMTCARSQLAAWLDLAALTNVTAETSQILVIDVADVIRAVLANLASGSKAAATTASAGSARSASAASATLRTAEAARARFSLFSVL